MIETSASQSPGKAGIDFWVERWRAGLTGWDQGGPHPLLPELIEEAESAGLLKPGDWVLEPGCGRAHNGAFLAKRGYRVTSFDVAKEAVAEASNLYGSVPHLKLEVADALKTQDALRGKFQAVFDRAMLCALPGKLRRTYVQAALDHLAPGGVLLTIPFTECRIAEAEGPPFQVTMNDLSHLLLSGFSLLSAADRPLPDGDRIAKETACIFRKRKRALVESG